MNAKNIRTIFFDYDGTLHDSIRIYAPAFRVAFDFLVEEGYTEHRQWSDDEIAKWLGHSTKAMWDDFMPDLDEDVKSTCGRIIGEEMMRLMKNNKAKLYDGAVETLEYLREKGYTIVFISNCNSDYKKEAAIIENLGIYFDAMVCAEDYEYIPKHEILADIIEDYPKECVIVGDRIHDIEAGKKNNIATIGCSYGFLQEGELDSADIIINDIRELKDIF